MHTLCTLCTLRCPRPRPMAQGDHINSTEDRAVLHTALRAPRDEVRAGRRCCGAAAAQIQVGWAAVCSAAATVRQREQRGQQERGLRITYWESGIGSPPRGPKQSHPSRAAAARAC